MQEHRNWSDAHFEFLVGRQIDAATLDRARELSARWGVPVHSVLIGMGWVQPEVYVERLAAHLGLPTRQQAGMAHGHVTVIDGTSHAPDEVRWLAAQHARAGQAVILGTDHRATAEADGARPRAWLQHAIAGLARINPTASARGGVWLWQQIVIVLVLGAFAGMALIDTPLAYFALSLVAAIPFALIVAQRVAILSIAATGGGAQYRPAELPRLDDRALPIYTLLVPLFGEAEVLPDLVAALLRIDYPPAKLDILIILEEVDSETRAVAATLQLPPFMRVVVVPDAQPRTKPKAMNYALQYARGTFVGIYDAEDVPDPMQLRAVLAVFAQGPANLGCVQAILNIHNRRASWFSSGIMAQTPQEMNPA